MSLGDMFFLSKKIRSSEGFTLVELIVVIILLGILSVTVLPKFFSSNGYEEYGYRAEVISKLRSIQLRAMQQTGAGFDPCRRNVAIENAKIATTCANPPETTVTEISSEHNVSFALLGASDVFSFDDYGRPSGCSTLPSAPCTISISGAETLAVIIEKEGYIHAN